MIKRGLRALKLIRDRLRLMRSGLFDATWYLESYPDLRGRMDPYWHYLAYGAAEGRDPGPMFSTSGYRLQIDTGRTNPLLHYEAQSAESRPSALPSFCGHAKTEPTSGCVLFFAHQVLGQQFGAERSLLHMLEHAGRAGLAVEVVLPQCNDPAYLDAALARARKVHILPCPWRRAGRTPHPSTIAAMVALIRKSGATEIHQNTIVLDAPLFAAKEAGVASVVYLRELPDQDVELCERLQQKSEDLRADLLAQADRFVANSPATAKWIDPDGELAGKRLVVLPNAVDNALFDVPFSPRKPVRVGMISSNTAKKGVADMFEVARLALESGLSAEFMLIGPETPDLIALGSPPANLSHAGYSKTPIAAIERIDILLSLSHFAESFGRTVLEALAAGRPVIAYDRGTPPSLIGTTGAGRVVAPDSPKAVVAALAELLAESGTIQAASKAARLRAKDLIDEAESTPISRIYAHALPKESQRGRDS